MWSCGSRAEKEDIEEQGSGSTLVSRGDRWHGTPYHIPHMSHASRGSLEWGTASIRFSGTTSRTFNIASGGSKTNNNTKHKEPTHRADDENGWHGDEVTLNNPDTRGSENIIAPVPRCKIRKVVEVSVMESDPTSLSLGNFTSAWGPNRKRPGPDLPVDMRTQYLVDHLWPEDGQTEDWETIRMRRLMG